jgi:hypothetical protein
VARTRQYQGDDEHQADEPNDGQASGHRRRARYVPDRPVNAGSLRSLPNSPMRQLTCVQAGRPAAQTDLLSNGSAPGRYPRWLAHHSRAVASVSAACGTCSAASVSAIMSRGGIQHRLDYGAINSSGMPDDDPAPVVR